MHKNIPKRTSTDLGLMRWRHPREEVAKKARVKTLSFLFDLTRCVRENWTSFRLGWSHLSHGATSWSKQTCSPPPLPRVVCVAPAVSLTNFPSSLPIPTPLKDETLLKQIRLGFGQTPREERGTWREMKSLRKRNCAQEEGRDWVRGRNTRWLPGTGDRQLAHGGGFGSSGRLEAHESQDTGVHVYRYARLARPRELRRAPLARAPEQREPTPPSDSQFPSLRCVSSPPPLTERGKRAGPERGPPPRPSSCSDWLMQLSILNLFFDGGGGCHPLCPRSRLPPTANHSCPSPWARGDWG